MGRRIGRIVLNGLAVLSLLLCVGTVALWVRSYKTFDVLEVTKQDQTHLWERAIGSRVGEVYLQRHNNWVDAPHVLNPAPAGWRVVRHAWAIPPNYPRTLGKGARHFGLAWRQIALKDVFVNDQVQTATVHLGYLVVAFGALPAWRIWALVRRRRRPPPGLCPRCRYDLTGNVSGVCPECGTAVADTGEGVDPA